MSVSMWAVALAALLGALLEPLLEQAARRFLASERELQVWGPGLRVACAVAAAGVAWRYGLSREGVLYLSLTGLLVVLALVDLTERRIPNACLLAAVALRLAFLALEALAGAAEVLQELALSLGALAVVAALLLCVSLLARLLPGGGVIGAGDVKLMLTLAFCLGFMRTILVLAIGSVLGVLFALAGGRALGADAPGARSDAFPFGPALALACWLVLVVGDWVMPALS